MQNVVTYGRCMKYTLSGNPIPLARARFSFGKVYNSQSVVMERCKYELLKQHNKQPLLEGALHLEITFYMKMANSWSLAKKERMAGKPHKSTPDFSNMLKFVEDCCNETIIKDDCLIYSVTGTKIYSWYPKTEFTFTEIQI